MHTIALQEANSSSEIEKILTTTDFLFKAFTTQSPQEDGSHFVQCAYVKSFLMPIRLILSFQDK
ncbi:MAG: Fic/DOC family N-terminal domain-containing protein [Dissulfurispiraceae bacterium]